MLERHRHVSDFCPRRSTRETNYLGQKHRLYFSFLLFSLTLALPAVPLYICRSTVSIVLKIGRVHRTHVAIQFISSSVRHTQLNGNMAVVVERRKELVHTHTFLCVERRLRLLVSVCLPPPLFFPPSPFLVLCFCERAFNQLFFFRVKDG